MSWSEEANEPKGITDSGMEKKSQLKTAHGWMPDKRLAKPRRCVMNSTLSSHYIIRSTNNIALVSKQAYHNRIVFLGNSWSRTSL